MQCLAGCEEIRVVVLPIDKNDGVAMIYVKDFLVALLFITGLLLASAFDDTYEDSKLSAQVLDEVIAQANEDRQSTNHIRDIQLADIKN